MPADEEVVEALAACFGSVSDAKQLLVASGFTSSRIPCMDTPKTFWYRIYEEVNRGRIEGGLRAIVKEAHREYHANPIFRAYLDLLNEPERFRLQRQLSGVHDVSAYGFSVAPPAKIAHVYGGRSHEQIKAALALEGYRIDGRESLGLALPHWKGLVPPASYDLDVDKINTEILLLLVGKEQVCGDTEDIQRELVLAGILGLTVVAIVEEAALRDVEKLHGLIRRSIIVTSSLESGSIGELALSELRRILGERERRAIRDKEELACWRKYLARQLKKSSGPDARAFLDFFPSADGDDLSARLFGRLATNESGDPADRLTHRFLGVKNCRTDNAKWVWYAWDCVAHRRVVVKEISPDKAERGKSRRLHWERTVLQRIAAFSVSGISTFVRGSCDGWFAVQYNPLGTVYWHGFRMPDHTMPIGDEWPVSTLMLDRPLWSQFKNVFVSVARTLSRMHEFGYAHRDIHPSNIFLSQSQSRARSLRGWWGHLGRPFGFSSESPEFRNQIEGLVGDFDRTVLHDSSVPLPEYLDLLDPGHSSRARRSSGEGGDRRKQDVYDLAHAIVQLMLGVARTNMQEARDVFKNANVTAIWPARLVKVLRSALSESPEIRPSMDQMARELEKVSWPSLARIRAIRLIGWGAIFTLAVVFVSFVGWVIWKSFVSPTACGGDPCDGDLDEELEGDITLEAGKRYRLSGLVFYSGGGEGELIIEPGARIYGEEMSMLVIGPDAHFHIGESDKDPVIFSSVKSEGRKARDWGGVVVLGNFRSEEDAPDGSRYLAFCAGEDGRSEPKCMYGGGGEDGVPAVKRRGTISNVRIEYSGSTRFSKDKTDGVNGLTLAGVGEDVVVSDVEVIDAGDDCFQLLGGNVEVKGLRCNNTEDDCFDWEQEFRGRISGELSCHMEHWHKEADIFEGKDGNAVVNCSGLQTTGFADSKQKKYSCPLRHPEGLE